MVAAHFQCFVDKYDSKLCLQSLLSSPIFIVNRISLTAQLPPLHILILYILIVQQQKEGNESRFVVIQATGEHRWWQAAAWAKVISPSCLPFFSQAVYKFQRRKMECTKLSVSHVLTCKPHYKIIDNCLTPPWWLCVLLFPSFQIVTSMLLSSLPWTRAE